jgi:hypothetical protein
MKEKLIALLGLKPAEGQNEVADEQIVATVADLHRRAIAGDEAAKSEKAIADLITQSAGALTRDGAKEVLANRASQQSHQN